MTPEERKALNRKKILEASIALFTEKSIRETTISQIAKAAGVVDKTVLNIFGSKNNLVFATMRCVAEIATDQTQQCVDSQEYCSLNGVGQVMRILKERARILQEKPQLIFLLNQAESLVATNSLGGDVLETYMQNLEYLTRRIDAAINKGISDGSIRKDLDREQAHVALVTSFRATLQHCVHVKLNDQLQEYIDVHQILQMHFGTIYWFLTGKQFPETEKKMI